MILSHLGVTYSFEKLVQMWVIFSIIYTHILSLSLRPTLYTLLADYRAGTQASALSTVFLFGSANKKHQREAARLEEEEETCSFPCASCSPPMDIQSACCSCENHGDISSHWRQQVLPQQQLNSVSTFANSGRISFISKDMSSAPPEWSEFQLPGPPSLSF